MTKQTERDMKIVGYTRENTINEFRNEFKKIKQFLDNVNFKNQPEISEMNLESLKSYMEFLNTKYNFE